MIQYTTGYKRNDYRRTWVDCVSFCLLATSLLVFFSKMIYLIRPETFAVVSLYMIPYGLLLASIFLPVEFLIFSFFDTQKADISRHLQFFLIWDSYSF